MRPAPSSFCYPRAMAGSDARVTAHYSRGDLAETILRALAVAGKDLDRLTPDDLAPVDQFHGRGLAATIELAQLTQVSAADRVLDVGCGIGGPARFLAHQFGARVSGIDLTPEFIAVAQMLAERLKLADKVDYRQASALELPFPDASFDLVWSQNVAMNIADRRRFYGEMRRVLKPKGRVGLSEVLAGPNGAPHLPTPWARDPAASHCRTEAEVRQAMAEAGLRIVTWIDTTAKSEAYANARAASADRPPPLGTHLIFGAPSAEIYSSGIRSYAEGRMRTMEALLQPAD
jgi:ubiquinone/menaquinone biosynthesis C-methylase UbiE